MVNFKQFSIIFPILILLASLVGAQLNLGSTAVEIFFLDTLQRLVNQKSVLEITGSEKFKALALEDVSNDELAKSTTQEIITKAGFKFENYYSLSDDGYLTQIVRIINPLADRSRLKQPPVMMFHGGNIDVTCWIWASIIQHHPEPWPRTDNAESISSSNRSLAFVLANHGYDVFLVSTRGVDQSRGHTKFGFTKAEGKLLEETGEFSDIVEYDLRTASPASNAYWNYTYENLVQFEVPRQMDRVMEITGASKVSMIVLSLSTQWSMALFSSNPEYSAKVHQYVQMAPLLNNIGANTVIDTLHQICKTVPDEVGHLIMQGIVLTPQLRDVILAMSVKKRTRYSLIKGVASLGVGPSGQFTSLFEMPVLGHLLKPVGFKQVKHYCQIVTRARLQKFDYGHEGNMRAYGKSRPPAYDISKFMVKNWILVSGTNDVLSTTASVRQVLDQIGIKPLKHIAVRDYNHMDLIAGVQVDTLVNLPVLHYLDEFALDYQ